MNVIIAFAALIAGISATILPQKPFSIDFRNERIVTGQIESAINDASQAIKDAGLDPFHIKRESTSYELPVPVLFNYVAFVEEVLSTGLSNIVINRLNYALITSRLTFDLELPLIHFSAGAISSDTEVFGHNVDFKASGQIEIVRLRVTGEVRVSVGIISGISIRSLTVNLTLDDVNSDVSLVVFGTDYSDAFNNFVGSMVPDTIRAYNREINELLEIVLLELIEANL